MLAVQRPSITDVASEFRRDRLIAYKYGDVRILNRAGLEKASCECYGVIRGHLDRLHI
jgi:hypothetical protein